MGSEMCIRDRYKKELGNLQAIRGQKYKLHYLDNENETLKNEFDQSQMLYMKKLSYHKQVLAAYKRWVGHQEKQEKKTEVEILKEGEDVT